MIHFPERSFYVLEVKCIVIVVPVKSGDSVMDSDWRGCVEPYCPLYHDIADIT